MTNPNDAADGMTKREYFAIMILQGLSSTLEVQEGKDCYFFRWTSTAVRTSLEMADELIAELNVDQNKRFSESINNADDDVK